MAQRTSRCLHQHNGAARCSVCAAGAMHSWPQFEPVSSLRAARRAGGYDRICAPEGTCSGLHCLSQALLPVPPSSAARQSWSQVGCIPLLRSRIAFELLRHQFKSPSSSWGMAHVNLSSLQLDGCPAKSTAGSGTKGHSQWHTYAISDQVLGCSQGESGA